MSRRTLEYGCAVVIIGLLAGVAGAATTLLLHGIEHLTYHYQFGTLLAGVGGSSPVRRALGPMIGGALAGFGWWMLRRRTDVPPLSASIKENRRLPRLPLSIDAGLQVLLVGSGASLGREGAPRQLAAALGDFGTERLSLTPRDREILLACAAGAGLAAVYSVPLGGAIFATRILLGTWHPRAMGTALITSSLAVAVASPVTHLEHALTWPEAGLSYLFVLLALADRAARARGRVGVQRGDGAGPAETADRVMDADSRDRVGRAAGRHLLHLVAGTTRQRPKHPDGESGQRTDPGRGGCHPVVETPS